MRRTRRRFVVTATTVVTFLLLAAVAIRYAGEFLVRRDAFTTADVAVVLSGEPMTRTLAARDLHRERRVPRIVIIPEAPLAGAVQRELAALELIARQPPVSVRILLASGVPPSAFLVLPEPIDGTIAEARRIRRLVDAEPSTRIVVITAKSASRRACFIFGHVLRGREIICAPTPYDSFEPRTWWRQPRDALNVVVEYQKLIANALTLLVSYAP